MDIQQTLSAGVAVEFQEKSDFLRVFSAANEDLTIIYYSAGKEISRAEIVGEGYSEQFINKSFDKVRIQSTAGGAVHIAMRFGTVVGYDKAPVGDVSLVGTSYTQGRGSLTNVVQSLIAANANRRYLLIQNNDASANMRLTLDGTDPTATQGIKLEPGESLELAISTATGEVRAMMETASAAADNVEWLEG